MSKRAIVLGSGMVGATIARELSRDSAIDVTVADVSEKNLQQAAAKAKAHTLQADLGNPAEITRIVRDFDLALGALPSRLGFAALRAVIEAGRPYADISFMSEDAMSLSALARERGVTAIVDCGVSPGLSNLF